MSISPELAPRFRLGDWVSYLVGFRRVIARVVEDRGPLGMRGRRIYELQLEPGEDGGRTIDVPEHDLEPAPAITTAEVAIENNFSMQNWPRQTFHVRYERSKDASVWTVRLTLGTSSAVPRMVFGPREMEYAGGANLDTVRVDVEYDPRLTDPRANPFIWKSLIEKARRNADAVFRARHPKAKVIPAPVARPA
jgi:hypothetical protein